MTGSFYSTPRRRSNTTQTCRTPYCTSCACNHRSFRLELGISDTAWCCSERIARWLQSTSLSGVSPDRPGSLAELCAPLCEFDDTFRCGTPPYNDDKTQTVTEEKRRKTQTDNRQENSTGFYVCMYTVKSMNKKRKKVSYNYSEASLMGRTQGSLIERCHKGSLIER
jgi:hypothetical protein